MPQPIPHLSPHSNGDDAREYLFEMIAELAMMARRSDETAVAIHLEAILAARDAESGGR